VVAGEVDAWARYEGGKAGDEVFRTEPDVRGAVAERVLELIDDLPGGIGWPAAPGRCLRLRVRTKGLG